MKIDFSESRPNPEDERKEFLSAALLVPSLSKNPSADQATLIKAITSVDLNALDAGDQKKFDASLQAGAVHSRSIETARCSRRRCTSPATRTSMQPGSGRGRKRSTSSDAPSRPRCS